MKTLITRRSFLKGSLAAGGLTIAVSVTPFGYSIINAADKKQLDGFAPSAWLRINPDNTVTITVGQSEMGQGVLTAQSMIVADELDADWKKVRVQQGLAEEGLKSPLFGAQVTVASQSIRAFYEALRNTGAVARTMLVKAAAETWKVPESECKPVLGTVKHAKSDKSLTYGQLCNKAAMLTRKYGIPEKEKLTLKKESEFRYMGKIMPRIDVPEKVKGKAVFGLDVQEGKVPGLKGMLIAVIARPPVLGAKPESFKQEAAEKVPGVVKVVKIPMGIAVCATSTEAALKGRDALKVQWDKGSFPDMDDKVIEQTLMGDLEKPGPKVVNNGDIQKSLGDAAKKLDATYYVPMIAHATMEPINATAWVQADRCEVWVPTQGQTGDHMVASKISGLPPQKVFVHTTFLGCGLGRRARPDVVPEAVMLSKATGKPVKVMWTREEDFAYDWFRSPVAARIQAGLDAQGNLTSWSHKASSISISKSAAPDAELKGGIDWYNMWGLAMGPTKGIQWNNEIQYEIPNLLIEFNLSNLPQRTCPWRTVIVAQHAFTIESFMDELAKAAGKDPLEFRLQSLKNNKRAARVLQTVAEKAGWGKPPAQGQGRGIAMSACFGTWLAQVADVSVDKSTGKVKVHKVYCAVDCGPVINPGPLVEQVESGIIIALSTALKEKLKFAKGGVATKNYEDYPIIRMSEVPDIEVAIVKSTDKIGGIGEPPVAPLAPAVANAVFAATGARIRTIPMTPEVVLAALKKA